MQKDGALSIRIIKGVIKLDGISYKCVREGKDYPTENFRSTL